MDLPAPSSPFADADHGATGKPAAAMKRGREMLPLVRRATLVLVLFWLCLVAGLGWWLSQRIASQWTQSQASSAAYEAETTARVVDRLFTQMVSVANMVASQSQVIELAKRYREDPPGLDALTRQQRAAQFTADPLVRKVGDFMDALGADLRYARIYQNNLSDDTITASNWAAPDSIVGMIYSGRIYLNHALRDGSGHSFGIARINKTPSYFVASRIDDAQDVVQGSVTVKFDAPDMAHYLTGRHTALIVNQQGRVTTSSSEPFMLRNVAGMLPAGVLHPSDDEDGEALGDAMDIQPLAAYGIDGQWLIDGKPYVMKRQPLNNRQYQLLTLASLEPLAAIREQHLWTAILVASVGTVLILLSCHILGQMVVRRQDEKYAAMVTSALNADLSTALSDAQTKERQKVEVLGYIGHDLRAPLATIKGYSELLLTEAPEKQQGLVKTIQRSVKYQLDLIDELLEYAKSELQPLAVRPAPIDLQALLADISDYAVSLCSQQNNHFHCHVSGALPRRIAMDGKRLQQVLLNLISNAAKFTRDGVVTLSVNAREDGEFCVLHIAVSDTGIGIDLAQKPDIFDAFQQIQTEGGSTGLGLFISQRILMAMGGSLEVSSAAGQGTTFSFELSVPIIERSGAGSPEANTLPGPPSRIAAAPVVAMATPGDAALDELAELALQGRLTDIEGWINRHTDHTVHALFTAELLDRLEQFDFAGIHQLALRNKRGAG
ncbi:sensor histidine kinase [Comamonas piscis]|uniref:histidine kinase n=1 Tax=Comamonas piscis TaxID=1562974 RepID=A0A7G5ELI0_9BURK|nr:HAMP domain-containing sensor histidine kinase [Comamonas piscis]QMV74855.1 sensor histidine kinase [Comamonas piscis]WSO33328.1 HAMP domain-containing sensor histidine kinase [Comamonas piscis]